MKIYLAARYSRRLEMLAYATAIEVAGHVVTSRWILGLHEMHDGPFDAMDHEERRKIGELFAQDDLDDLDRAELLIAFTEPPGAAKGRARGGWHVELGYALGRGKKIAVIGWRENVFCCLPQVMHFTDWGEFLETIQ